MNEDELVNFASTTDPRGATFIQKDQDSCSIMFKESPVKNHN